MKQIKHLEHILETFVYSHCNLCNIPMYVCSIDIKHLQHTFKTSETLENIRLQHVLSSQCHLAALTNGGSSLRSSTPVQRSGAAAVRATRRRGGITRSSSLACWLEHPSWRARRLGGAVEWPWRAGSAVEAGCAEWGRRTARWRRSREDGRYGGASARRGSEWKFSGKPCPSVWTP